MSRPTITINFDLTRVSRAEVIDRFERELDQVLEWEKMALETLALDRRNPLVQLDDMDQVTDKEAVS
ncbi:MAG: hypothetical protein WKF63_08620 [Thermomicrobiales bacterium]